MEVGKEEDKINCCQINWAFICKTCNCIEFVLGQWMRILLWRCPTDAFSSCCCGTSVTCNWIEPLHSCSINTRPVKPQWPPQVSIFYTWAPNFKIRVETCLCLVTLAICHSNVKRKFTVTYCNQIESQANLFSHCGQSKHRMCVCVCVVSHSVVNISHGL